MIIKRQYFDLSNLSYVLGNISARLCLDVRKILKGSELRAKRLISWDRAVFALEPWTIGDR